MMGGGVRRYLIAYDISDDKRRTDVYSTLEGFGDWAQYSIFLCEMTGRDLARLRGELRTIIHHGEDQVMILDLGIARHALEQRLSVLGRSYVPPVRSVIV